MRHVKERLRFPLRLLVLSACLHACIPASHDARADEPPPDEIVAVRIHGNDHVPEQEIRAVMQLRPASFLHSTAYDPEALDADILAVKVFYRSRGYLETEVRGRAVVVNARTLPHQVAVELEILEGKLTVVTGTRFEGHTLFSIADLERAVRLKPPAPYDSLELEPDVFRIQALYLDRGYLRATVTPEVRGEPGWRTITHRISEGPQYRVGGIRVEGNGSTRPGVVTRELTLGVGDIFGRRAVLESEQNIYDTGLFTRVDLIPGPHAGGGDSLDLVVRVRERRAKWVGAGVGYGTLDELRLSGEWGNRNLGGTARRLSAGVLYATQVFPLETRRVRLDAALGLPRIAGSRSLLTVSPFFERQRETYLVSSRDVGSYQLELAGANASLRREFDKRTRLVFSVNQSWIRLRDPSFTPTADDLEALGVDSNLRGQEASVTTSWERDTRDDFLNPRRGTISRVGITVAAARPLGLDKPFAKFTGTQGRHHAVGREAVVTTRLSLGAIAQVGRDAPVPDRERFKIGGESTLRGYADRSLGPGNGMFAASLEWLFPLPGKPRGFVFADAGGVWEARRDIKPRQFARLGEGPVRYTSGLGMWIPTPVGPLKLGYGQRLGRHPVGTSGRLFVVFGQAF